MPRKPKAVAGHVARARKSQDTRANVAASPSTNASGNGPLSGATQLANADSLAPIIAEIRAWHRQRVFAMDQRKRADLALGAFLRTQFGWSRSLPKAEGEKIRAQAASLITLGEKVFKGKETGIGNSAFGQWGSIIMAAIHGRAHWDAIESAAVKEMERLARSLPVWDAFGEGIKGFGARSLAVIVGEAGDLSLYANPAKLWKRMGLAVMSGVRQGGLRKTASAEDWIAHGYSAKRRSFMFVIGDVLIKNKNVYRDVYLERKEFERAKAKAAGLTVAPAAKIPEKRKAEFMSDGHVHRKAQRYMEKRLLKHLWQAWRRARDRMVTNTALPAAPSSAQAERPAQAELSSRPSMRGAETSQTDLIVTSTLSLSGKRRATEKSSTRLGVPAAESNRQTDAQVSTTTSVSASRSANPHMPTKEREPSAPIPVKAGKRRARPGLTSNPSTPAATNSAEAT